MDATACLEPFGGASPPSRYLVRLWIPAPGPRESWRVSEWWVTDADSVEEVIDWAREQAEGSPAEVLAAIDDGTLLHLWGAEPEDASTTVTVTLWSDEAHGELTEQTLPGAEGPPVSPRGARGG